MPVRIDPIVGPFFNPAPIYQEISKELVRESEIWERMFNRATSTWSMRSKPKFERKPVGMVGGSGMSSHGVISMTLESSSKPWIWVEGGTRRRYKAVMSSDYRPKTRRRTVGSGPGAGYMLKVLRGQWAPGIPARDVRFVIAERRRLPFARNMTRRIAVGLTKAITGPGSRTLRSVSSVTSAIPRP